MIVAVTDIHGNASMVKKLADELSGLDFEMILIAGDVTHFGNGVEAKKILEPLLDLGRPVLAVMGNCDGRDVSEALEELGISVHNRRIEINGKGVVGFGGSNITPFSTVWEFTEEEIKRGLEKNYRAGDIILTHAPPHGTSLDRTVSGLHVGSQALRKFIEERRPPLVVCGHIHEGRGVDVIGETVAVNPGPLFRGYYALIENRKVELRRLR
ncbi:metallophosphoesterase [Pyrococcus yayanosii]|nr:metallophosphoesterase [Pyrococcus yayanosii]